MDIETKWADLVYARLFNYDLDRPYRGDGTRLWAIISRRFKDDAIRHRIVARVMANYWIQRTGTSR
jgi:hypothetical protein